MEEGSDVESFHSESEDDGQNETERKRPHYNNPKALEQRLIDIFFTADWIERLDVLCSTDDLTTPNNKDETKTDTTQTSITLQRKGTVHDDFKREMHFYCQAQVAAKESLEKLRNLGIPTERPDDYFAEMVKTDVHMHKIREKLSSEKKGRENAEKAKKMRRMKQFGKKVQQEVLQKRQAEKKKMLQSVDRMKRGKDKLKDGGDMFDIKTDNSKDNQQFEKSMKRKRKDQKYGHGGKKKRSKMNTAETSADMSGFKSSVHSKSPRSKNKAGKGKPKRLGKIRRHQVKSKKR